VRILPALLRRTAWNLNFSPDTHFPSSSLFPGGSWCRSRTRKSCRPSGMIRPFSSALASCLPYVACCARRDAAKFSSLTRRLPKISSGYCRRCHGCVGRCYPSDVPAQVALRRRLPRLGRRRPHARLCRFLLGLLASNRASFRPATPAFLCCLRTDLPVG
jgi:hypothetical protein